MVSFWMAMIALELLLICSTNVHCETCFTLNEYRYYCDAPSYCCGLKCCRHRYSWGSSSGGSSSGGSSSSGSSSSSSSSDSGPSAGAIVGYVFAGLGGLAMLVALCSLGCKKCSELKEKRAVQPRRTNVPV